MYPFISCHSEEEVKNTISPTQKLPTSPWNAAIDSHQDYTSASSEMHGEHKLNKIRKAGL